MATQVRRMPVPVAAPRESSGGIITQLARLVVQPKTFFSAMPNGHQWLLAALLILVITGFSATLQTQSSSTSASSGTQTAGFSLSLLDQTSSASTTNNSTTANNATSTESSDTTLMNALLAASGVLLTWAGETVALSMVTMLRGYAPQIGRSLQIAVWATLPLALMLVLRDLYYANGGTGGALGLSLLLSQWSGYNALPQLAQRVLAVFTSNLTLFWLWSLLLLYMGARYALGGRRLAVLLIVLLWIVTSTFVPALIGQPQTRTAPRQASTTTIVPQATRQSSTTATQQSSTQNGGFGGFGGAGGGGGFGGGGRGGG